MNAARLLLRLLFGRRLPLTAGSIAVAGLERPVIVRRDRFGVPYIEASSEADAWFALGFCQAQDRAFQLELRLRTVRGTLSELFGARTLAIDRLSRRIGFREASRRHLAVLDAQVRTQIAAFVAGVNAGLAAAPAGGPHELALLRSRPTPWQEADVVGVGKLFSFLMVGNWDVELARLKILQDDGPGALRDLDPSYPPDHYVTVPSGQVAGDTVDRLSRDLAAFVEFAGRAGGSNSWVVAGWRTASGRPILASDPHLEPMLPPHWYLARLTTPEWQVAGASLVGVPAFGAGHNGHFAWGLTAALVDTVDLFIEDIGPDGRSVRLGEGYVPCRLRRERIEVRGGKPVEEDVLETPHGPIIGTALTDAPAAIALRAVWLDARPARGFLRLPAARSWEEFRRELSQWPLLVMNVTYADAGGRIAYQLAGEAPRRRKGWGTLPLPGWDPEAGWEESPVPFADMPRDLDPATGFVATANNKPQRDGEGPYLGCDWLDGYRASRVVEALSERTDWDIASTLRLQVDELSLPWREVRDVVLSLPATTPEAELALSLLQDWDGRVSAGSAAASVFELFIEEMWRRIAMSRAPRSYRFALGQGFSPLLAVTTFAAGRISTVLRRLREQPPGWFERSWPEEMADALTAVIEELRSRAGDDTSAWAWGKLRPLTFEHPLGRVKALARVFDRGPFPFGGDGHTLSQAGTSPLRPLTNPLVVASLRFAVEAGDWDRARFVLPGGQSGNPFSPHYDDQLPLWLATSGIAIAWSPAAVAAVTVEKLRLLPLTQSWGMVAR